MKRRSFPKSLLKSQCETCGSTLALELDHWDNNPSNDDPSNAATLCHACHELKTQLSKEKGAAHAAATRNDIFRRTVEGAIELIGADTFRKRRDAENQEWLDERTARAARLKAGSYVEVTEYKCPNTRRAHELKHRSDSDFAPPTECPFCHMPLDVVKTYRIHKRLVSGQGWLETIVPGSEVTHMQPERSAGRGAATLLGAALFLRLLGELGSNRRPRG